MQLLVIEVILQTSPDPRALLSHFSLSASGTLRHCMKRRANTEQPNTTKDQRIDAGVQLAPTGHACGRYTAAILCRDSTAPHAVNRASPQLRTQRSFWIVLQPTNDACCAQGLQASSDALHGWSLRKRCSQ